MQREFGASDLGDVGRRFREWRQQRGEAGAARALRLRPEALTRRPGRSDRGVGAKGTAPRFVEITTGAVTPPMRVRFAVEPADFGCGIDGLARVCRAERGADPLSGTLFVSRNRRATALNVDGEMRVVAVEAGVEIARSDENEIVPPSA